MLVTAHSCVASWWSAVRREPLGPEWSRYVRRVRHSLACANGVVAPSRPMLDSLRENYGLNTGGNGTEVIPNGCRALRFYQQKKEPFILGAGRLWDEAKGTLTLARCSRASAMAGVSRW